MADGYHTIEELLARTRAGDERATAALLQRYRPWLRQLAAQHSFIRHRRLAHPSDVTQDILLKVQGKLRSFSGTTAADLERWMSRILTNTLIEQLRAALALKRRAGRQELDGGVPEGQIVNGVPEPQQLLLRREEQEWITRMLEGLRSDRREALWLHYIEDLSVPEVSVLMGKSRFAVGSLIRGGLKDLRRSMCGESPNKDEPAAHPMPRTRSNG